MSKTIRSFSVIMLTALLACIAFTSVGEEYEYDPAGRLQQITESDGSVTLFRYDALGNLLSVRRTAVPKPPTVTSVAPTVIRVDDADTITLTGTNLEEASVQPPSPAFDIGELVTAPETLSFLLTVGAEASLGQQTFQVVNDDGAASFDLTIWPPLPRLSAQPLPLALPNDGSPREIAILLSNADVVERTVHLEVADPSVAEIGSDTVVLPVGETQVLIGARGLTTGITLLTLSSDGLDPVVYSVYVVGDAGNVHVAFAEQLGIHVEAPDEPPPEGVLDKVAAPVGLLAGAVMTGVSPQALDVDQFGASLTVQGYGLQDTQTVAVTPLDGITIAAFQPAGDGRSIAVLLDVAADAPLGIRHLMLEGADGPILPAAPDADRFWIASPPALDSIHPSVAVRGTGPFALTVRGEQLSHVERLRFEPSEGISIDTNLTEAADGTELTTALDVAADAALGERTLIVTTPGGETSTDPSPANTLTIAAEEIPVYSELVSPAVGLQVADEEPPMSREAFASLGLARAPFAVEALPRSGVIGTLVELRISGTGLDDLSEILLDSSEGIGVGAPSIEDGGTLARVNLDIAADAPETLRRIHLYDNVGEEIPFADPAGGTFLVTAPIPVLDFVYPNTLEIGTGAVPITLGGQYFHDAVAVRVTPEDGLSIGTPDVSPDGRRLTLMVSAAADAATGPRLVQVVTSAGISNDAPAPRNTLTLYQDALVTPTPVVSPVLGIQVEEPATEPVVSDLIAPLLGLVVEIEPEPPEELLIDPLAAPRMGLTVGPVAYGIDAPPLVLGGTYELQVTGRELQGVDGARLVPGLDVQLSLSDVAADGTEVRLALTVPPDAAIARRTLELVAGPDHVPFTTPALAAVYVGRGLPRFDSIQPIVATAGETLTLTIRGTDLTDAVRVYAEPSNGLFFAPNPSVNDQGSLLTVDMGVAADAPVGPRTIRVETPVGDSSPDASSANTFTVY